MIRNPLYLLCAFGLLSFTALQAVADIPVSPERKRKIAETPRITPKGQVTPLADRHFTRTVGAGKAKIVIPKAVFDDLVAAVTEKAGGDVAPTSSKPGSIPPIALIFAGLALSGACLYFLAKAPRYRLVTAVATVLLAAGGLFFWTQQAEANAGPPPPRVAEGQIIIEVPSEGTEVAIYVPEAAAKTAEPEAKPK